jgi:flagellar motor switch protein FliN/FliY
MSPDEGAGVFGGEPRDVNQPVTVSPAELAPLDEGDVKADPSTADLNLKMVLDIPVDVHVEIGHTRVSIRDLLRLGVGSVVELDRLAGQPADVIVNGKLIGQGDVVVVNETFGIRITKLVGLQERIQSL